ncbi:MAG: hypothetical protein J6B74_03110, partial [Ruminococcus sp.]|nr:hypothetical protein [Ruminococcus sp.]
MKKLNKIMSGLMSVCLCVANVSATCISVSAESSENNWKYLYKEALNQLVADGWTMEDNSLFNGSRFDLYELNGDGISKAPFRTTNGPSATKLSEVISYFVFVWN